MLRRSSLQDHYGTDINVSAYKSLPQSVLREVASLNHQIGIKRAEDAQRKRIEEVKSDLIRARLEDQMAIQQIKFERNQDSVKKIMYKQQLDELQQSIAGD